MIILKYCTFRIAYDCAFESDKVTNFKSYKQMFAEILTAISALGSFIVSFCSEIALFLCKMT